MKFPEIAILPYLRSSNNSYYDYGLLACNHTGTGVMIGGQFILVACLQN